MRYCEPAGSSRRGLCAGLVAGSRTDSVQGPGRDVVAPARRRRAPDELTPKGEQTRQRNRFGPAVVNFAGAPDFSPTRIATPGPNGFPLANFQPAGVAGPGYSPFIRIAGSNVVYNAPIVATGDGPFDVTYHNNTEDRVLGIHLAPASPQGQFLESYADMLLVRGFDAGQPILYLSTDAG